MRADLAGGCAPGSRRDPGARLIAALEHLAGGRATLLRHRQRPWASITFSGTRHELNFRFSGAEGVATGEAFLADLPDHEFAIPRQLVADVEIKAVDHVLVPQPELTVELELLLLDEG